MKTKIYTTDFEGWKAFEKNWFRAPSQVKFRLGEKFSTSVQGEKNGVTRDFQPRAKWIFLQKCFKEKARFLCSYRII